jgi:hypothetical protein
LLQSLRPLVGEQDGDRAAAVQQNAVSLATLRLSVHPAMETRLVRLLGCLTVSFLCACFEAPAQAHSVAARASGESQVKAAWYEIVRTPGITAYLDTARVDRLAGGVARIWFRFRYAEPMIFGTDSTTKYSATEAREELDCAGRRTRDLELRTETTTGITAGAPFVSPPWQSIDTHALNSGVFLVACRALGTPIAARPGG